MAVLFPRYTYTSSSSLGCEVSPSSWHRKPNRKPGVTSAIPPCTAAPMGVSSNVLDVVSDDVLGLVLDELKTLDFPSVCASRLVCKALNGLAESRAFGSTLIDLSAGVKHTAFQIESMASGNGPNSRWTKELRIRNLVPEEERGTLLDAQDRYLIQALESLRKLRSVELNLRKSYPYLAILSALSNLPHLKDLNLYIDLGFEDTPLPLDQFSNLRSLILRSFPLHQPIIEILNRTIRNSQNTLECLDIRPHDWEEEDGPYDSDQETEETPDPSEVRRLLRILERPRTVTLGTFTSDEEGCLSFPKLEELQVNGDRIEFTIASVPLFKSLVCLAIVNAKVLRVEDGFWDALAETKVQLQILEMYPLTSGVVKYLLSYTGLHELILNAPPSDSFGASDGSSVSDSDIPRSIFKDVLPHHCDAIHHVSISEYLDVKDYGCTEENIEGLLTCKKLEELDLLYHYPVEDEEMQNCTSIGLALLFRITDNLPKLKRLQLAPACSMSPYGENSYNVGMNIAYRFADRLCNIDFREGLRFPPFRLYNYGFLRYGSLVYEPKRGCYAMESE
ncbi:hypothetical protein DFP72DRAFT_262025 [Ephemerocybe angulata]|uniref:F-box domain-containing protein n=1 Tax=Ephemerocybe angulata TaxID=980116 RepID=A0A8H6I2R0_9AGAR|nr:hypothetical protein DFP72DRAFT_262025 [Tulosesus angulatus]